MKNMQEQQHSLNLTHQLAQELSILRDALTHLSLTLQDLNFEVDAAQRETAMKLASDCIARQQPQQP